MKTLIVAAALLVTASSAFAATPQAHRRQVRQERRIEQGWRHGGLTPREAMRLQRAHWRIQREIARARADGRVTRRERARILRMQRMESRRIWMERHDRQRRGI